MKTGLVVEGGGMKCAYSAGILDRFLDEHITFDYCIGVSAGSANTASYLAGQRGRNLRFYVDHLNEPGYMNLGYEGALAYSTQLIKQVASANGELVLLWHNDSITTRIKPNVSVDWQRKLFAAIIEELIKS